ncbi:MAG TPA: HAMP domain-containing histidine kinase [Candidatus Eisenbergiella merdavium]|uniref:histidine kinase n=1 Tax=Candidatus Eisenbergiella merdavium TaxID=2838551 RepID=A0A9D2NIG8_9FIRM|nr:HAMP domain-containing histidine kinase [Candidatus Eisenbergiella merdavium]
MDIKLKSRFSKFVTVILICAISVLLCFALYYFIDEVLNGSFVNWFEENYMITEYKYIAEIRQNGLIRQPNYAKIKLLLLWAFVAGVLIWLAAIFLAAYFHSRSKVRQSVTQISRLIHDFMNTDSDSASIFPKEYAEISVQMAEIKSAMQRHEQILKEEAARKNDLITYLAHDLKTPLTSVIGYLSLLDDAPDLPLQQRAKYVHITLDKAQRLESLINEFFEITRYNLQQIEIEKETIDLYYMLVQMTDEFYPLLQKHGNRIELHVDENLTVHGDAMKLARVFNNILKNAIAYSYPDSVIEIWAQQNDTMIYIYFQNKGKTIPPHKLDSVFEKFFRLDEARTTNTGGAGLGLAIAKEIVALHGGSITADSKNEITTFCVSLPLCD